MVEWWAPSPSPPFPFRCLGLLCSRSVMAQSQTQLVVIGHPLPIQMMPLRQMSLSLLRLLSLLLMTFLHRLVKLANQKLVLSMLWSMGVTPAMLANDLNIPEFSTEESQLSEGMLWGYSSDPPSCTLWGDSVPAAGDGIESPPPPMPQAVENGSSSPVPCISLLEDSPGLSAEKAAMPSTYSHDMKRAEFNDYKKFLALAKEKLADMKRRDSHLGAEVFTSLLFSPPGQ